MRWSELDERQPRLAAKARERLVEPGVLLVVSLRKDGTPRLSPVEPYVMDGRLLLSMLWQSRKARDLQRDPRVLVHGIVTGPDGGEG
ncbi:MAG TPA: pyridoxamine 5'-phosphate oxidase family protein, partial [Nocardioides sp.]|nr:pyridoxamine 5'-phosphate oxidase family protein [Nocardioides sp.]